MAAPGMGAWSKRHLSSDMEAIALLGCRTLTSPFAPERRREFTHHYDLPPYQSSHQILANMSDDEVSSDETPWRQLQLSPVRACAGGGNWEEK